jgi:hypothetical protein
LAIIKSSSVGMPAEGRYAVLHRNSDISSIDAWFEFELVEYVLTQLLVIHGWSPFRVVLLWRAMKAKRWSEPTTLTWIKLKSEPREIQKAAQSNLRRVD